MSTHIVYGSEYLSKRLREHRLRLGMPLSWVAGIVDIPEKNLEEYEQGAKSITKEELIKLSDLYQVSPRYFLGGISIN